MARWGMIEATHAGPSKVSLATYTLALLACINFRSLVEDVLNLLLKKGVVTAGVLAGELGMSRSQATKILNRFVERGLAERCMCGGVAVNVLRKEVVKAYAMAEEVEKAICL